MITLALSLVASVLWGLSDFLGGVAARRMRVLRTTAVSYVGAVAVLVLAALVVPGVWSQAALATGTVAGVATMVGFLTFYAAFAAGSMGVVSAEVAVLQSVVPIVVAVSVGGERLALVGWVGVGLAVLAGVLLGLGGHDGSRPGRAALTFGAVSGVAFGVAVVSLDAAPSGAGVLPATVEAVVGLLLLGALLLATRLSSHAARASAALDAGAAPTGERAGGLALCSGVVLGLANALLLLALQRGALAVVAVVIALYPIGTTILARVVLHERLHTRQVLGIGLALVACALLALS
ncbi:MAG: EamA family transporter [Actinobacteria bacterium]|nr:EamA family transporter [Actinomycetota bacterium]MCG2801695.1 EamA family transporter [Cellulomonas sp.]